MWWRNSFVCCLIFLIAGCTAKLEEENTYPFSKVDKIEVVSYINRELWDTIENKTTEGIASINKNQIKERITLTKEQTDNLFKFLFIDECPLVNSTSRCFEPRHMIVFYNEKGKELDYIEVCLECGTSESGTGFSYNDICNERTDKLAGIFKEAGIKYFGENE